MSKKEKWEIEPDYLHCIDEETGYFYYIYRDPEFKHLCGYVEIPNTHKVYWLSYMDELFYDIDVHGGVAYTGTLENPYAKDIRHNYVVGFDCNYAGDYAPGRKYPDCYKVSKKDYKDMDFVISECKKLAKQLKDMED